MPMTAACRNEIQHTADVVRSFSLVHVGYDLKNSFKVQKSTRSVDFKDWLVSINAPNAVTAFRSYGYQTTVPRELQAFLSLPIENQWDCLASVLLRNELNEDDFIAITVRLLEISSQESL